MQQKTIYAILFDYTNPMYMETLKGYGVKQSMSREGELSGQCADRKFFRTFKRRSGNKVLQKLRRSERDGIEVYRILQ